jgi:hypothetical protein
MKSLDSPYFFIIGSQRSGTTLLRLILNSNDKIAIPTEATFLMPFLNKGLVSTSKIYKTEADTLFNYLWGNSQFQKWELTKSDLKNVIFKQETIKDIISDLYRVFSAKHNKTIAGDKSPTFIRKLPIIKRAFPHAKFIYIVRDGRDTFLSLKAKKAPGSENLALGAIEWRFKQSLVEKHLRTIPQSVYKLRYEDLLKDTEKELNGICNFLDIEYQPSMLQFWKNSEGFIAKHHSVLIFKPIDASNTCKWKKAFSCQENAIYSFFAKKYLTRNDYEISDKKLGVLTIIKCVGEATLIYLPKRIFKIVKTAVVMRIARKSGKSVGREYYD